MKIGLLAGGGKLPGAVIAAIQEAGDAVYVADLGMSSEHDVEGGKFSLGEFGKITKAFKSAGVTHVCFAGNVTRPDFKKLKPDFKTLLKLPAVIKAARNGDDALLSFVVETFEKEGFAVVAPQELCKSILMPAGNLGEIGLTQNHRDDAEKAMKTALEIGKLDIGQGVVVCRGLVLAVEAQEGTDAMLKRVAELPQEVRGSVEAPMGVLAKMVKPGQEKRVDLPTIGPKTVRLAKAAGLAGIITEAGNAFVLDREELIAEANAGEFFVTGLPPSEP